MDFPGVGIKKGLPLYRGTSLIRNSPPIRTRTLQKAHAKGSTVVLGGGAFFYERGVPICTNKGHTVSLSTGESPFSVGGIPSTRMNLHGRQTE